MRCAWPLVLATAIASACRDAPRERADATVTTVVPPTVDSVSTPVERPWREQDGAILLAAADDAADAFVVPTHTDDTLSRGLPQGANLVVELLARTGRVATATVTPVRPQPRCGWPRLRVAMRDSVGEDVHWAVALAPGVARGAIIDSLESMPRPDSTRLVADLARMLSALGDDTIPHFRGLPFAVRGAWRFGVADGTVGVAAEVHRRVAQEAKPFEERLLVLAERDTAAASRWRVTWWARTSGTEETVEALDVLAVVRLGRDPWPTLVAGHDAPAGTWHELVARDSTGAWRSRWRSTPALACDGGNASP